MKLRTVLIIGLAIRLAIAPFFAHPFDVFSWYVAGESVATGERTVWFFLTPYQYSYFLFAFPATYALNFLSRIIPTFTLQASALNPILIPQTPPGITVIPGPVFDFIVKLPLIISDVLAGYIIYRIVVKHTGNVKIATTACILWLLNPLTIWVSSGWGTFDTLPALFTIAMLYFLLDERFELAGISFTLSIVMKYYSIVLLIPLIFISWRLGRMRGIFKTATCSLVLGAILLVPALDRSAYGFSSEINSILPSGLHYSGLSIFTAITLFEPKFDQRFFSIGLLAISLIFVYAWTLKFLSKSTSLYSVVAAFALPLIALLLFYNFVGENFVIWILPFSSILALRNGQSKWLHLGISLVALLSSVVDSLLPFYLLPASPWIGGFLVAIISFVAPYRVAPGGTVAAGLSMGKALLSAFGIIAFLILTMMTIQYAKALSEEKRYSPEMLPKIDAN